MEISYQLVYYKEAFNDLIHWKKSGDKQAIKKINEILDALETNPYSPTPGNPEELKYTKGFSRRINKKDRITYGINDDKKEVVIFRMRGHYNEK